jgi:glycosyltransferase involved in cell wall biosynthesis
VSSAFERSTIVHPKLLVISNYAITLHNVRPEAEMIIGLKQRGLDVEVMTPRDCPYAERMAGFGIPIHDYLPPSKFSAQAARRVRQVLRDGAHQLQYLFNNPAIVAGLRAARGLPVRNVTYRGQVGNISRYDPSAYLTHLNPRVDRIVCVANAVRDSLRQELRDPSKAVTIYKGHDIDWYSDVRAIERETLGLPSDAFLFVCVATNRPRKGVPVLLDAISRLPADSPVHLLLVGGGMDGPDIDKLVRENPHRDRIHRFGHRDDVLALVAAADAAVLPSLRREGLPKTVIEAMALGLPPIVTRTGGSPELIVSGESGWVVPPGEAEALAAAMQKMAGDPGRARRMGAAAKRRLVHDFNLQQSIDAHLRLFTALAA